MHTNDSVKITSKILFWRIITWCVCHLPKRADQGVDMYRAIAIFRREVDTDPAELDMFPSGPFQSEERMLGFLSQRPDASLPIPDHGSENNLAPILGDLGDASRV